MIKISKICGIKFHEKNSLINGLTLKSYVKASNN